MSDVVFSGRKVFGPREMYKTACTDCGQVCELPFHPVQGRAVYCQACLPKHKNAGH